MSSLLRVFLFLIVSSVFTFSQGDAPATYTAKTDAWDYSRREVMIPMRDGVKLKTFVVIPKGAKDAPMLLVRTPYNADSRTSRNHSSHMAMTVPQMNDVAVESGYIIVYQDVRGKYGSEGDYIMTRPLIGPRESVTHRIIY